MADYSVLQPNKPTNLAGYCRVAYCAVDQVAVGGFPRVLASRLTDTITLASGETFSSMPLLATTLQLTEREITDTQGTRFETTLTGRLPMAVAQRDDLFRIMVQRRWLAVGTDGNGNQRLLGTPRYPARFSFEHDNAQGRNEYVVTWRAITPHPSLYVESVTVPTPGVCAAASVTVNGDSPALSVASGGTLDLGVVDTDDVDVGTRTGSKVTVGDSAITVNGNALTDLRAEQDLDVEVVDESDNPIGSLSGGKWVVPAIVGPGGTAKVLKTGETISYATGDDGDTERGRHAAFSTLDNNNPFGNTSRFTDELGGASYANNIVVDWFTFNGAVVLGYYKSIQPAAPWADAVAAAMALSVGSFSSGWYMPNINELFFIADWGQTAPFGYAPFSFGFTNLWSATTTASSAASAWRLRTDMLLGSVAKTTSTPWIAVREFTVTGTTLS